ncbi:MAG: hypothetical protein DA394_08970 [Candidatus Arcticimaribacter sp.]|nr:MAG: hypothetical protein DA394_08970 [Candidatus Arcticimaribacter sp.]
MMEKSTEPNESKQEEGINGASEISTSQEEQTPTTEPQTVPEVKPIKTQLNFDTLELEAYADILKKMIHADDWPKKGKEIQEIISQFDSRFGKIFAEKKKEHIDVEGNDLDFEFSPTYKKEVSQLIREYKTNKNAHYKSQEKSQKENLEKRLEIIEQIKALIGISENNSNNYKKFRALQESWHQTGQVPRAESNNVWETYKHHVERFYDFLHLDRALREKDFKHNYEEKLKLIERAETLVDHQDVVVAIRELNVLHRQWKTDLGPVAREHREELWNRFQDATAKIHERKNEYNKNIDAILLENLAKKRAILTTIEELYTDHASNHNAWQNSLKQVNTLKEEFHNIGRIPRAQNKAIWNEFRLTLKNFNHQKNEFYKTQKQEEKTHIEQKKALITEVKTILESADWRSYTDRMKAIQVAWKKTGRISRKLSNQLWEEFKTATDLYFARLKNKEEAYSEQDQAILKAKRAYFEDFKSQEAPTEAEALAVYIETAFQNWNAMGEPSEGVKNSMQREYTDFLRGLWNKTELKGEEKVAAQFKTDLLLLKDNEEGLNKEHILLKKKIDESKTELIQLENNLAFFSTTSSESPMVQEVNAKIKKLNDQIEHWGNKVKQIKTLSRELKKSLVVDSTEDTDEVVGED